MKTLEEPTTPSPPWWIGACARCTSCSAKLELEAEDSKSIYFKYLSVDYSQVSAMCPHCRRDVVFTKDTNNETESET